MIMTKNLNPFHTFHLDVKAKDIVEIYSIKQLIVEWRNTLPPKLLLGQGSNVLFLDDFKGTVFINCLKGIHHYEDDNFHYLQVSGGENWHHFVKWTLDRDIAGLENLALIPGCVGSSPIQNIGAYGVELEQVCDYVEVLDLNSGKTFRLTNDECQFGYRDSIFKHQYKDNFAIITVGFKLAKMWQPKLEYGSLSQFDPETVTAKQIFDEVCKVRMEKLPNPEEFGNAGSFFKNPVIEFAKFEQLRTAYPQMPHYIQSDGTVKLPAGWLIDQCNLKGFQVGGAMVHLKQALVLINKDNATGKDIVTLAKIVRQKVHQKFGVIITPEVRFIGAKGEVDSEEITR
ncbi:UDP-N-acetylmuramate dehydrogenase [Pasteurella skyensis]|uniref:UDP-N-acetylenolpyruvoylglucosamine reductase n=1 Tax=Phocoenobacter skyensis TaxID=97481 RepID=A0AAJ6N800_9PAST|nr:UDP-N-acetylmuramate dehydrogenase [Pasteurella skyensis]MDP8161736.1 UDP-N-acetylmuramate dehydrogenase [Pasteurella skyensis]MDP8171892.1 UDP-N-acetylmuramate dehydrogenase [Pasteurella skyensis]MDP8178147.1 UDP-N-acetylmuramate dehydrogenase [Pasteurella skyensis]MDP8182245.1 UDP-N-acetylmuramate dehydrogenase [Pasteurella skyensis]MDP8188454.1 UDP-N-acetylmuramate dehydrogenase [Pasteurella skyensis]